MSVQQLVDELNEAVTHLPGVQDVNLPEFNNPFEFYGALIADLIPKAKVSEDAKSLMAQLANYYSVLGESVDGLDHADRFESKSSLELIGIARLAMDHARLKQLIGTLLFVDEMLEAFEARRVDAG